MLFAEWLAVDMLGEMTIFVELEEDPLRYLGMLSCRSTTKDVKAQFKPLINVGVDFVVLCTQLFWGNAFF